MKMLRDHRWPTQVRIWDDMANRRFKPLYLALMTRNIYHRRAASIRFLEEHGLLKPVRGQESTL